ncbi:MAG TPA: DUF6264 family protein [Pseudolysinimonas sp.]
MSEPEAARPAKPQYGEYATPEEVLAARGPLPNVAAEPVPAIADRALSTAGGGSAAPIPSTRPRQANNLITVLLLVVGIWNTVTSIPSYLDLGPALSQGLEAAGYGTIAFGTTARVAGIVLLVFSLLVLIAAAWLSLRLIRLGRRSIWVPVAAAGVFLVGTIVIMTVVVANTPALADVLHNH